MTQEKYPQKPYRLHFVALWKIYLDFQYFLLCCPFRLAISPGGRSAIIKSNLVQKTLCLFYNILGFFWTFRNLPLSSLASNPKDPSMYLFLAVNVENLLVKCATVKRFWFDETKIVAIIDFILDAENNLPFPKTSSNLLVTPLSYLLAILACLHYTGMAIIHFLTGRLYYVASVGSSSIPLESWNVSVWWDQMLSEGRFSFFINGQVSNEIFDRVAGILAAVGYLWRLVLGGNEELFFLLAVLTMWIATNEFQTRFKAPCDGKSNTMKGVRTWSEISREYDALKILADKINGVFGWTIFYMVIQTALFNSVNTDDIFMNEFSTNWPKIVSFIIYSLTIGSIFLLMADCCRKVVKISNFYIL